MESNKVMFPFDFLPEDGIFRISLFFLSFQTFNPTWLVGMCVCAILDLLRCCELLSFPCPARELFFVLMCDAMYDDTWKPPNSSCDQFQQVQLCPVLPVRKLTMSSPSHNFQRLPLTNEWYLVSFCSTYSHFFTCYVFRFLISWNSNYSSCILPDPWHSYILYTFRLTFLFSIQIPLHDLITWNSNSY